MSKMKPWDDSENAAVVALYFRMLDGCSLHGEKLNKAAMIRVAQDETEITARRVVMTGAEPFMGRLRNRSRASIEFKLMNCTACHMELVPGVETMHGHGYRAQRNYQASLKAAMAEGLSQCEDRAAARVAS